MKALFLIFFFVFSAYSAEDSAFEEEIMFTVEDTPKEFFEVEDTEKLKKTTVSEETTVSSEAPVISKPTDEVPVAPLETEKEEGFSESESEPNNEYELSKSEMEEKSKEVAVVEIYKPKVDVLIVIDNSGSMKFILRGIGRKMQSFKDTLNLINYRIAFLSAGVNLNQDKQLMDLEYKGWIFPQQKFVEPNTDNQILIDTLVRGKGDKCDKPPYCGGGGERPLGALEAYFVSNSADDFIREDSEGVAVVVITDNNENQRSNEEVSTTAEDVVNIFHQRYPGKAFKAYTLTILDEECQAEIRRKQLLFREGHFAPIVTELADWTVGEKFSLCLPSYQEVAEQIVSDFLISE